MKLDIHEGLVFAHPAGDHIDGYASEGMAGNSRGFPQEFRCGQQRVNVVAKNFGLGILKQLFESGIAQLNLFVADPAP